MAVDSVCKEMKITGGREGERREAESVEVEIEAGETMPVQHLVRPETLAQEREEGRVAAVEPIAAVVPKVPTNFSAKAYESIARSMMKASMCRTW